MTPPHPPAQAGFPQRAGPGVLQTWSAQASQRLRQWREKRPGSASIAPEDGASTAAPQRAYLHGAAWAALAGGAAILLPLVVFVLFARALGPAEIGRFALAVSLAEVLKACGLPGFYEAVLHRRARPARNQASALTVFLLLGVSLLPLYAGGVLALVQGADALPPGETLMLLLIGLRIPLDLALLQPQAELARRAAFSRLAMRGLAGNTAAAALGLGLLAAGQPMLGLGAYTLGISVGNALATVLGTRALRWPGWSQPCIAALWPEAVAASAVRGCATANNQLDQLLVGAIAGPVIFAQFNLAKRIESAFASLSSSLTSSLFQPDFARRASPAGRTAGLGHALSIVTATSGAVAAGFMICADLFVPLMLGPAWAAVAPAAAVLALSGYGRGLASVHGALLSVSGRNGLLLRRCVLMLLAGSLLVAMVAGQGALAAAGAVAAQTLFGLVLLALATRADAGGRTVPLYLFRVVLPFAGMLAAALAGRWLVLGLATPPGPAQALAAMALAGAAAALVGLAAAALPPLLARAR